MASNCRSSARDIRSTPEPALDPGDRAVQRGSRPGGHRRRPEEPEAGQPAGCVRGPRHREVAAEAVPDEDHRDARRATLDRVVDDLQRPLPRERLLAAGAVRRQVGHDEVDVRTEQRRVAPPLGTAQLRPVHQDDADRLSHAAILAKGLHGPVVGWADERAGDRRRPRDRSSRGTRSRVLDVQYSLRGTPGTAAVCRRARSRCAAPRPRRGPRRPTRGARPASPARPGSPPGRAAGLRRRRRRRGRRLRPGDVTRGGPGVVGAPLGRPSRRSGCSTEGWRPGGARATP